MAALGSLPNELLDRVISYVHAKADLANLRLVSRAFDDATTPFYFATVPLYAHWWNDENSDEEGDGSDKQDADEEDGMNTKPSMRTPNDVNYNARTFKNILDNERLSRLVKKVVVYTCNPDCVGFRNHVSP